MKRIIPFLCYFWYLDIGIVFELDNNNNKITYDEED